MRSLWVAALMCASGALAHDLSLDIGTNITKSSSTNPRAGSVSVAGSGTYDFSDAWSAWLTLMYTRDFASSTTDSSVSGSNVFSLNAGAMFLPTDHWSFIAAATFSPLTEQVNTTTFSGILNNDLNVVIRSQNGTIGGSLGAAYFTAQDVPWNSAFDANVGVTVFRTKQQLVLGTSPAARALLAVCETSSADAPRICPLVGGVNTPLTQARIGLGYTAMIGRRFDVALDGAVFIYDRDPTQVGYFPVLSVGRTTVDLGNGVPLAPYRFTLRPSVTGRFGPVSVRLLYQFGFYAGGLGANHTITARASWKVNRSIKLSLSLSFQSDVTDTSEVNVGGLANVGIMWMF